jgi:hypothetical protein
MPSSSSASSSSHPANALSLSSPTALPASTIASLEQQLADEADLQRCAETNHRKILNETMAQLKHELLMIQSDDWMFENPKNHPHQGDSSLPAQSLSFP